MYKMYLLNFFSQNGGLLKISTMCLKCRLKDQYEGLFDRKQTTFTNTEN